MKSIDFFSLYVVQKSLKIFLYEPKKLCQLQKKHCFQVSKIRKIVSQKVRIILAFQVSKF